MSYFISNIFTSYYFWDLPSFMPVLISFSSAAPLATPLEKITTPPPTNTVNHLLLGKILSFLDTSSIHEGNFKDPFMQGPHHGCNGNILSGFQCFMTLFLFSGSSMLNAFSCVMLHGP